MPCSLSPTGCRPARPFRCAQTRINKGVKGGRGVSRSATRVEIQANIPCNRTFTVFVVFTAVGCVVGLLLLLLWWKDRKRISMVVDCIRKRKPPAKGEAAATEDSRAAGKAATW